MHKQLLEQWARSIDSMTKMMEITSSQLEQAKQQHLKTMHDYIDISSKHMGLFLTVIYSNPVSQLQTPRTALVINGTNSPGDRICMMLAEDGFKVLASYDSKEETRARQWQKKISSENSIEIIQCDTNDFETCRDVIEEIHQRIGHIDLLINCSTSLESAESVLDCHLDRTYNVIRNVIVDMSERGFGRIINITPLYSSLEDKDQQDFYIAKAGLRGFTKALADEVAEMGVSINTITSSYGTTSAVDPQQIEEYLDGIPQAVANLIAEDNSHLSGTDVKVSSSAQA